MQDDDSKPPASDPTGHAKEAPASNAADAVPDGAASSMPLQDEKEGREERRRKRKRLRNLLQSQGDDPLFTAFLTTNFDVAQNDEIIVIRDDEDDEDDDHEKPVVVIDVDVELGLKEEEASLATVPSATLKDPPETISSSLAADGPVITRSSARGVASPMDQESSAASHVFHYTTAPLDEGWYEGKVSPIALAEDSYYLSPVHCWVRENLEFFSADAETSRRKRGRVGLCCKHCATQAHLQKEAFRWPTGALSYPNTFTSVHQACAQRFQVHWQTSCPSLPAALRAQFQFLAHEIQHVGRPGKRSKGGLPTPVYYNLSMQQIGLVETPDGLRFGRDLSLQPLPLETVRATMLSQQTTIAADDGMETAGVLPTPVASSEMTVAPAKEVKRGPIDEAAERVLAECIAEADQPDKYLARSTDKALVTDYVFIAVRQMAICHALPVDMTSRGKKTKMLRVGLAGFCCRHCQGASGSSSYVPNSCRSYLSAPDNLASAITNSFTQHLQKCPHVPPRIPKSMGVFRRYHQRQMAQLPFGSQRRFFHTMWDRLRQADQSHEEMEAFLSLLNPTTANIGVSTNAENGDGTALVSSDLMNGDTSVIPDAPLSQTNGFHRLADVPATRPVHFPESPDECTREALRLAEVAFSEKNVEASKVLLLPEERNYVSDYVFLTLMQLRPTIATAGDGGRNRRPVGGGMMGVACIHCADSEHMVTPSGRSFPSAPDNFASALNTSLYNHMQACYLVPVDLKKALVNLRKLHSAQCSALVFGGQRSFFRSLFQRLHEAQAEADASSTGATLVGSKETLDSLGFFQLNSSVGQTVRMCKRCRMIPAVFRARDAVSYDRLSLSRARLHRSVCQEDGLDLALCVESFRAAAAAVGKDPITLIESASFQALVHVAVGENVDLTRVFVEDIAHELSQLAGLHGSKTERIRDFPKSASPGTHAELDDNLSTAIFDRSDNRRGLWKRFPVYVSFTEIESAYQEMRDALGIALQLREVPALLDYLMIISPSLSVTDGPETNEPGSSDEGHERQAMEEDVLTVNLPATLSSTEGHKPDSSP